MNFTGGKVRDVDLDDTMLTVWLEDGRVIQTPLSKYPSLQTASVKERKTWRPCGLGEGIHWPLLDYDLDVKGILLGFKEAAGGLDWTRRFRKKRKRKLALRRRSKA